MVSRGAILPERSKTGRRGRTDGYKASPTSPPSWVRYSAPAEARRSDVHGRLHHRRRRRRRRHRHLGDSRLFARASCARCWRSSAGSAAAVLAFIFAPHGRAAGAARSRCWTSSCGDSCELVDHRRLRGGLRGGADPRVALHAALLVGGAALGARRASTRALGFLFGVAARRPARGGGVLRLRPRRWWATPSRWSTTAAPPRSSPAYPGADRRRTCPRTRRAGSWPRYEELVSSLRRRPADARRRAHRRRLRRCPAGMTRARRGDDRDIAAS